MITVPATASIRPSGRIINPVMLRVFGCFGLGIIFLAISPHLRNDVTRAIGAGATAMSLYAPYSYVASGIAIFIIMMMAFKRGAAPR